MYRSEHHPTETPNETYARSIIVITIATQRWNAAETRGMGGNGCPNAHKTSEGIDETIKRAYHKAMKVFRARIQAN